MISVHLGFYYFSELFLLFGIWLFALVMQCVVKENKPEIRYNRNIFPRLVQLTKTRHIKEKAK